MITYEQYISALEIVNKYHDELQYKLDFIERSKKNDIILFQKWLLPKITINLDAIITLYRIKYRCEFIEDIDFDKFSQMRGIGKKYVSIIQNYLERYKKTL